MNEARDLPAREVYQILKDVALGVRSLRRMSSRPWKDIFTGTMTSEVDGWMLVLHSEGGRLGYCESCTWPDSRSASLEDWHRFGTNPVDFLSAWEREKVEQSLNQA